MRDPAIPLRFTNLHFLQSRCKHYNPDSNTDFWSQFVYLTESNEAAELTTQDPTCLGRVIARLGRVELDASQMHWYRALTLAFSDWLLICRTHNMEHNELFDLALSLRRKSAGKKYSPPLVLLFEKLVELTSENNCALYVSSVTSRDDGRTRDRRVLREVAFHQTKTGFRSINTLSNPARFRPYVVGAVRRGIGKESCAKRGKRAENAVSLITQSLSVTEFPGSQIPCIHFQWAGPRPSSVVPIPKPRSSGISKTHQYPSRAPGFEIRIVTQCSLLLGQRPIDDLVLDQLIPKGLLSIGQLGHTPVHSVVARDELMGYTGSSGASPIHGSYPCFV